MALDLSMQRSTRSMYPKEGNFVHGHRSKSPSTSILGFFRDFAGFKESSILLLMDVMIFRCLSSNLLEIVFDSP